MFWTAKQRTALIALTAAILLYLGVRYSLNRTYVHDPQVQTGSRAADLPQPLDPNTAAVGELATIPAIGKSLAQRIVADRQAFLAANPGKSAYEKLEDLQRVNGIGPATLLKIEPYLTFGSQNRPETQP